MGKVEGAEHPHPPLERHHLWLNCVRLYTGDEELVAQREHVSGNLLVAASVLANPFAKRERERVEGKQNESEKGTKLALDRSERPT